MVDELKVVLVKPPQHSHVNQAEIDAQWQNLHYLARPSFERVTAEFDQFMGLLNRFNLEIAQLPPAPNTGLDSIYTHDPAVITDRGVILCTLGKAARLGEADAQAAFYQQAGIPILGRIEPPGTLEGGDVCWIDSRTVAVGEGYRTNAEGIRQLQALLGDGVQVLPVPLPHWTGPDDCLHLLSFISPVAPDLAVVYSRMMPVPFRQWLIGRGMRLVEVPDQEYESFACNVLALDHKTAIMVAGNPVTQSHLEAAGIAVWTFEGQDLCIKGGGGPTCLTRPILREGAL
jgi:N-dimethylarginine dimethylaminohydrolase